MSLERAYTITRLEFAIALFASILASYPLMGQPAFMGLMFDHARDPLTDALPFLGVVGAWSGTGLMYWIWRRGPEAGPSPWRYRRETD